MKEGKELFLKHLKECGVNLERIKWYKQAVGYKLYSRFKDVELAAKLARSFNDGITATMSICGTMKTCMVVVITSYCAKGSRDNIRKSGH